MRVKMADHLEIYLCDHCASVHICLFRDGKLYAEAIPANPESVLADFTKAIAESRRRQSGAPHAH